MSKATRERRATMRRDATTRGPEGWGGGSRLLRCSSSTYRFGYAFVVAPCIRSPGAPNERNGSLEAGSYACHTRLSAR